MRQSLRLGKVAGIPVGVHWSVGVILIIVAQILGASVLPAALPHQSAAAYWTVAVIGALVFAASLLAHEMAHALVARHNGMKVRSITLWMLGGVAELEGEAPSPGADLRVAAAGPVTSLAIGALLAGLAFATGYGRGPAIVATAAMWLAVMNGLLAVFNMLPGAPLDGGRVLRAVLWLHYRDRQRAALAAATVGRYLGFGLMLIGLAEILVWGSLLDGLWLMLIGWFLESAARAEAGAVVAGTALSGLRVADVMTPDPDIAPAWSTVQEFIDRVAAYSRSEAFPVVTFDGRLVGVVVSGMLARVRPEDRATLRVDRVALTVPPEYQAAPGDPARSLLDRPPLAGEVAAVVLDQGRVVGLVTARDLDWRIRRARMGARPSGWSRDGLKVGHGI